MGDRANVYIHDEDSPGVYIYTHWNGTELPQLVKEALATDRAQDRLTDTAYLTRILIEELTKNDRDSATGWGVSAQVGDGSDRIVDISILRMYSSQPEITLKGYGYAWDNIPLDPYNTCGECGQPYPD